MRYLLFLALLLLGGSTLYSQQIKAVKDKDLPYQYWLHLPKNYDANKSYPLLLYLHGRSIRGTDLNKVKRYGVIYELERGLELDFIVIAPQCQVRWENDKLIELLDDAEQRYPVNLEEIYLTGMSMGGYGAWYLAGEHPDRFAAVAPVAGGGRVSDAKNMKNLPHWVFHGAKDKPVPASESKKMVAALRKVGNQQVKFDLYPNKDHGDLVHVYEKEALYEWFLEHKRDVPSDLAQANTGNKPAPTPTETPNRPRPQRPNKPVETEPAEKPDTGTTSPQPTTQPEPEKPKEPIEPTEKDENAIRPRPEKPAVEKPSPVRGSSAKWWQFWRQPFWTRWLG